MEAVVANVDNVKFDIEVALEQQLGAQPLPFVGMDKSTSAICEFFIEGSCAKASQCPFRHVRGDRTVVCKHWLRGLCKKGDQCEFLHEYDMTKMPECYFYTRFNACHNKECPFLHIDPESKVRPCPWYDRGFCRHGPHCRHKHIRKVLCLNYLAGFCPEGPECKFVHAQFDLPQIDETALKARKAGIICHVCGEAGHKSYQCPKNPELAENSYNMSITSISSRMDDDSSSTGGDRPNNIIERVERNPQFPPLHSQQPPPQPNQHPMMLQQHHPPQHNHHPPQHNHHPPHHQPHHDGMGGHPHGGRGGRMGRPGGDHPPGNFNSYQPYQFHPRPPFYGGRGHHRNRDENRERGENRGERGDQEQQPRRALEDVVCYKCGYKGHYANKCNKGHLAFLSHKAGHNRDAPKN